METTTLADQHAPRARRPVRRLRASIPHQCGDRAAAGPDADAPDERIGELWLRDRPTDTRVAYKRDDEAIGTR